MTSGGYLRVKLVTAEAAGAAGRIAVRGRECADLRRCNRVRTAVVDLRGGERTGGNQSEGEGSDDVLHDV